MKNKNYMISIPEPCHEDWNSMIPDSNGRFCNSCSKSVIDFTNKTDLEIHEIMMENKDKQVCGHLKASQVNRPLSLIIPYQHLPQNLSPTRAFAVALFIVFGTFLFSCTNEHHQKIDEIIVSEPHVLKGIMMADIASIPVPPLLDTIVKTETQESIISCSSVSGELTHVDGGIEYIENPMVDSLEEVTIIGKGVSREIRMLGGMVSMISPDTIEPDSNLTDKQLNVETTKKILNANDELKLLAFPNPSIGNFNISYEFTKRGNVILDILDIKGVLVRTLVSQQNQYEGKYIIPIDLSDLVNGIYLCRLNIDGIENTTKLIIAK